MENFKHVQQQKQQLPHHVLPVVNQFLADLISYVTTSTPLTSTTTLLTNGSIFRPILEILSFHPKMSRTFLFSLTLEAHFFLSYGVSEMELALFKKRKRKVLTFRAGWSSSTSLYVLKVFLFSDETQNKLGVKFLICGM